MQPPNEVCVEEKSRLGGQNNSEKPVDSQELSAFTFARPIQRFPEITTRFYLCTCLRSIPVK